MGSRALPEMAAKWQKTMGWQPDAGHLLEFQSLYEQILAGNQQLNLTRIVEPKEFWEKHLWDSLRGIAPALLSDLLPKELEKVEIIDIGTGAGFPGLPVAIARPDWQITLLDASGKKIDFLNSLIDNLGFENVTAITARAEEIGQQSQYRSRYELALARAVAPASVCAEYALPLLKVGGLAVLYRGQWSDEETESLSITVKKLGGIVDFVERFTTPLTRSLRHSLYLRKIAPTPEKFPRPVGVPGRKPL